MCNGSFYNSVCDTEPAVAAYHGEAGYIQVPDFVIAVSWRGSRRHGGNDVFTIKKLRFPHGASSGAGLQCAKIPVRCRCSRGRLVEEFSRLDLSGQLDPAWPQWTLATHVSWTPVGNRLPAMDRD